MDGRWPPAGGGSAPVDSQRRAPNLEHCFEEMNNGLGIKDETEFVTRTVKGVRRLAARTAGAMEETDMVVMLGE